MPFIHEDTTDPRKVRYSLRNLNDYIREEHYTRFFRPSDVEPGNDVTVGAYEDKAVGIFYTSSPAQLKGAYFALRKPEYWRNGEVEFEYIYSGDTGDTDTIRWNLSGGWAAIGDDIDIVIPAATSPAWEESQPGPADPGVLLSFRAATRLPVDSTHQAGFFTASRDASHAEDLYSGDAILFHIILRYIPEIV